MFLSELTLHGERREILRLTLKKSGLYYLIDIYILGMKCVNPLTRCKTEGFSSLLPSPLNKCGDILSLSGIQVICNQWKITLMFLKWFYSP